MMKNIFKTARTLLMTSAVCLLYLAVATPGYAELIRLPVITYISPPSMDNHPVVHIKWASRMVDVSGLDEKAHPNSNTQFNIRVHVPGSAHQFLALNAGAAGPLGVGVGAGQSWRSLLSDWVDANGYSGSGQDVYIVSKPKAGQCYQFGYDDIPMPGTECMEMPVPNVSCHWNTGSSTIALGTATDEASWKKLSGKTTVKLSCSGGAAVTFDVDDATKSVGTGNSALTLSAYSGGSKLDWPVQAMTSQDVAALDLVAGTSGDAPTSGSYNESFVVTANWE